MLQLPIFENALYHWEQRGYINNVIVMLPRQRRHRHRRCPVPITETIGQVCVVVILLLSRPQTDTEENAMCFASVGLLLAVVVASSLRTHL